MNTMTKIVVGAIAALVLMPNMARAEILAMMNYESKTEDSLKALQIQGAARERREGIAVMDIDPLVVGATDPDRLAEGRILMTFVGWHVIYESS